MAEDENTLIWGNSLNKDELEIGNIVDAVFIFLLLESS